MSSGEPKIGDLRVWWIPQVPMPAFYVPVQSVEDGVRIMDTLADYDAFQFQHRVKGDYSNVGGIERWCPDNGDDEPGWESWYDEETGEDDPRAWLAARPPLAEDPVTEIAMAHRQVVLSAAIDYVQQANTPSWADRSRWLADRAAGAMLNFDMTDATDVLRAELLADIGVADRYARAAHAYFEPPLPMDSEEFVEYSERAAIEYERAWGAYRERMASAAKRQDQGGEQ